MRKIRTSLLAVALSALALGLVHGQAAYGQFYPEPPLPNVQAAVVPVGNAQMVRFSVYDPSRRQWMTDNVTYTPDPYRRTSWFISDLTNRDGVVSWQAVERNPTNGTVWNVRVQVGYAMYDHYRARWVTDNVTYTSDPYRGTSWFISDFTNRDGVVSWQAVERNPLNGATWSVQVYYTVYDPIPTRWSWRTDSVSYPVYPGQTLGSIINLTNQNRGVFWLASLQNARSGAEFSHESRYVIYDPFRGVWARSTPPAVMTRVRMYGTYHAGNTDHFYTIRAGDKDIARSIGYADLGVPFQVEGVQLAGTVPFRRFYRGWPQTDHIYLTDSYEISHVLGRGWVDEGVEGYIYASPVPGTVPLYRLNKWNSVTDDHDHQYTTNWNTVQALRNQGWGFDRVQGYVWPAN